MVTKFFEGVCGIDELLVVSGGDTLTPDEAISFLNIQVQIQVQNDRLILNAYS